MVLSLSDEELTLETERLVLRPFVADDLDVATRILCNPEVMRYVGDAITPEAVVAMMPDLVRRGAGGRIGLWCVIRKDTGVKIGDGVLLPIPFEETDTDWSLVVPDAYPATPVEVGYLFLPEAWGQGFASEVCARLLRFAREQTDLSMVVAVTDPDNQASQHVLQKCGMRRNGVRRAYGEDDLPWFEMDLESERGG